MSDLDFERKHAEDLQRLRGLRLLDDDFMNKVFEDKACAEFLLQIILQRTDLRVQRAHGQHDIKNLQGRSVRLDILAVDEADRVYNIEVQRSDKGAGVKRARYNSSLLDANVTEPGDEYEKLNETYVIFITEHDVLGNGHPIYHIDRTVRETGALFGGRIAYPICERPNQRRYGSGAADARFFLHQRRRDALSNSGGQSSLFQRRYGRSCDYV